MKARAQHVIKLNSLNLLTRNPQPIWGGCVSRERGSQPRATIRCSHRAVISTVAIWRSRRCTAGHYGNSSRRYGISRQRRLPRVFDLFQRRSEAGGGRGRLGRQGSLRTRSRPGSIFYTTGPIKIFGREHQVMAGANGYQNSLVEPVTLKPSTPCSADQRLQPRST